MIQSAYMYWLEIHEIRARELILQADDFRVARIASSVRKGTYWFRTGSSMPKTSAPPTRHRRRSFRLGR